MLFGGINKKTSEYWVFVALIRKFNVASSLGEAALCILLLGA